MRSEAKVAGAERASGVTHPTPVTTTRRAILPLYSTGAATEREERSKNARKMKEDPREDEERPALRDESIAVVGRRARLR